MAERWHGAMAEIASERNFEVRPILSFEATGANTSMVFVPPAFAADGIDRAVLVNYPSPDMMGFTHRVNEYVAELSEKGLSEEEILAAVTERDIELPHEVVLHYFLYCLDLETGAVEWKAEYHSGQPPGGRHRKNSFVSESPVTDGERVYVYAANLGLYAYSLEGEQVWTTPLKS